MAEVFQDAVRALERMEHTLVGSGINHTKVRNRI